VSSHVRHHPVVGPMEMLSSLSGYFRMRIRGFGELRLRVANRTVEVMDREIARAARWPRKSAKGHEITARSRNQERGRVIMIVHKPIVALVVVLSLML